MVIVLYISKHAVWLLMPVVYGRCITTL